MQQVKSETGYAGQRPTITVLCQRRKEPPDRYHFAPSFLRYVRSAGAKAGAGIKTKPPCQRHAILRGTVRSMYPPRFDRPCAISSSVEKKRPKDRKVSALMSDSQAGSCEPCKRKKCKVCLLTWPPAHPVFPVSRLYLEAPRGSHDSGGTKANYPAVRPPTVSSLTNTTGWSACR